MIKKISIFIFRYQEPQNLNAFQFNIINTRRPKTENLNLVVFYFSYRLLTLTGSLQFCCCVENGNNLSWQSFKEFVDISLYEIWRERERERARLFLQLFLNFLLISKLNLVCLKIDIFYLIHLQKNIIRKSNK